MTRIPFVKMNGAGNDFIMIDNRSPVRPLPAAAIRSLCDRRRGIGADGVILVEPATDADFRMRYYNADGGEAEMCGNGARCVAQYASGLGLGLGGGEGRQLRFMTQPGLMRARVRPGSVAIEMTDATGFEQNVSLELAQATEIVHVVNTGVPHAVVIVPDVAHMDDGEIEARGRAIRRHPRFEPAGTNANFITVREDGLVAVRTYERGVEAETLACGTGSVASAVVAAQLERAASPVSMLTWGGDRLTVRFELTPDGATDVVLEGPAEENFSGVVEIDLKE